MLKKFSPKNLDFARYPKIDSKLKKYNHFYFNFKITDLNYLIIPISNYLHPASIITVNNF